MNPLQKQIARLPSHIRDHCPPDQLRTAVEVHNALMSALAVGGAAAVKKWARKNMTPEMKSALIAMADADDKGTGVQGVKMGQMIRLVVQELEVAI